MAENQILEMRHPDFSAGESFGQIGDRVHLHGAGVAGDAAVRLERHYDGDVTGRTMGMAVRLDPEVEGGIASPVLAQLGRSILGRIEIWLAKARTDRLDDGRAQPVALFRNGRELGLDLLGEGVSAKRLNKN